MKQLGESVIIINRKKTTEGEAAEQGKRERSEKERGVRDRLREQGYFLVNRPIEFDQLPSRPSNGILIQRRRSYLRKRE